MVKNYVDINDTDERRDLINRVLYQTSIVSMEDKIGTYVNYIGYDDENDWAIVVALMDYDSLDDYKPYAKVAFQPRNSIMQCDFDVDWMMPLMNGEVWDTEISTPGRTDVIWMLEQFEDYLDENNLKINEYYIQKK